MGESWASLPTRWWWRQTTDCRDAGESGVRADYGHGSWWPTRTISRFSPETGKSNRDVLEEREVNESIELGFEGGRR